VDNARVRLVGAVVNLQLVVDDGETLDPLRIDPIQVAPKEWPLDVEAVISQVEAQLQGGVTPAEAPPEPAELRRVPG
jgi:hypothetical protein